MYEKQGKFYADWRDKRGKRIRKSFTSKRAALQHEADQKELAHPKRKAIGRTLPISYSLKHRAEIRVLSGPQRATSSPHAAPSNPPKSPRPMSKRLTIVSGKAGGRR
jgi:hypothetical protein